MSRTAVATLVVMAALGLAAVPTHAQSSSPDPPRVEFMFSPGGAIVFLQEQPEPGFTNFRLGGAVTVNLARFVAFEAEAGASFGIPVELQFGVGRVGERERPHTLDYNANLVVNLRTDSRLVPYLTAGAGAITFFSREALGLDDNENYFSGNAGGGMKWFLRNGRWGVRADYRFLAVRSKSDAPAFFGRTNRYGHRLYGALIVILGEAE